MKKTGFMAGFGYASRCALVVLSLFTSVFSGCKSAPNIDLTDYSPMAVVSIYSNSSVPWYDRDGARNPDGNTNSGGLVTSSLNKVIEQNNPEYMTVQERIDGAARTFLDALEGCGVEIVSMDKVSETQAYKSGYNQFIQKTTTSTPAEGYMVLDYSGNSRNRMIATETGASGSIFAEFIFQKEKVQSGLHDLNVAAKVTLKVYLADSDGKKALYRTYSSLSPKSVPFDNGNWSRASLVEFFPDAIESVVNQFIMDYTGCSDGSCTASLPEDSETQSTSISPDMFRQKSDSDSDSDSGAE